MVENIKKVSERAIVTKIQRICILGSARILREVLSVWTEWLTCVTDAPGAWFASGWCSKKKNTSKDCDRRDNNNNNNNNNNNSSSISCFLGDPELRKSLTGLIYEEETFQEVNSFKFITYSRLEFCDETGNPQSQRSGGICRLTNKRLLFLSQFDEASKCNLV